jgi:DNA-binding CsgD family transcriptional regulator
MLRLTRQGYGTKEIARIYNLNPAAIDQRFARIALRLNASSRSEAARIAYDNGLLEE